MHSIHSYTCYCKVEKTPLSHQLDSQKNYVIT